MCVWIVCGMLNLTSLSSILTSLKRLYGIFHHTTIINMHVLYTCTQVFFFSFALLLLWHSNWAETRFRHFAFCCVDIEAIAIGKRECCILAHAKQHIRMQTMQFSVWNCRKSFLGTWFLVCWKPKPTSTAEMVVQRAFFGIVRLIFDRKNKRIYENWI